MDLLPAPKEYDYFDVRDPLEAEVLWRCSEVIDYLGLAPNDHDLLRAYMSHRYVDWHVGVQLRVCSMAGKYGPKMVEEIPSGLVADEVTVFLHKLSDDIHKAIEDKTPANDVQMLSALRASCQAFHRMDLAELVASTPHMMRPVALYLLAQNEQRSDFDKLTPSPKLWHNFQIASNQDIVGMVKSELVHTTNITDTLNGVIGSSLSLVIESHLYQQEYWPGFVKATNALHEKAVYVYRHHHCVGDYMACMLGKDPDMDDPFWQVATAQDSTDGLMQKIANLPDEYKESAATFMESADNAIFVMAASEHGLIDPWFFERQMQIIDYHINLLFPDNYRR